MKRLHTRGEYNPDGAEKRRAAREAVGNICNRCRHPHDVASGHVMTTHHWDGNKANDSWYNLLPLCQRCHLTIQGRVNPETPWFLPHSDWLKPYAAGFYAKKYEGREITREEADARLDELLSYELRVK